MDNSPVYTLIDGCDEDLHKGDFSLSTTVNTFIQIYSREVETQWFCGDFLSRLSGQTEIEIHYQGKVFFWKYLNHYQTDSVTNLQLKLLTVRKNEKELPFNDVSLPTKLLEVSEPYLIKEDGWDLIWFGFSGGHMVFYFKKPEGVL